MYNKFFKSSLHFGSCKLLSSKLRLGEKKILPFSIPHGVDFGYNGDFVIDGTSIEPIYLAHSDYIFSKANKIKKSIKFPHPWVFLMKENKIKFGNGDLIISPPPSLENFEKMYKEIGKLSFNKKKSILIKGRGEKDIYFRWCKERNFGVEFAGNINDENFYYKLFKILNKYRNIYLINMSSAGIFAASIRKKIKIISNCEFRNIDNLNNSLKVNSKKYKIVKSTWKKLTSSNTDVSQNEAKKLLGYKFYSSKKQLRNLILNQQRYIKKNPIFLKGISKKNYRLYLNLFRFLPFLIKLYPYPLKKILLKIFIFFKINKVQINTYNDFSYFRIGTKFKSRVKNEFLRGYRLKNYNLGEAPIDKS